MAAELEETSVSYEELRDLENEFDEVEVEIIRQQYALSKSLYVKRAELVAKIPHFWPLVFEQAPMDIDEYIQPSDSAVLLASLKSISVSRFELDEDEKNGDPRSVAIRFEFADNDHFENKVLEKKFWWRQSTDGFAGLVSEPVEIKWKKGKDLTDGLLALVKAVYDEQVAKPKEPTPAKGAKKEKVPLTKNQKALKEKIESTGMGGVSFFAWFGYIGEYVTAEENKIAVAKEKEERQKRKAGEEVPKKDEDEEMGEDDEEEEEDEDEDDWEDDQEIFPTGDAIAMAIADDLWPGALNYFIQAQEPDMMSDVDFESDEDDEDDDEETGPKRPQKKHKGACAHGCAH
ncbi:nucleosome assembly protein [Staphylotrichum tortipilum]|uniref:Nucleosome assembly protein n=1 Tax=Staphylotrichum tortipilum TaxID=2831512 RepID=A0AAN6MN84_9PEZI|nr:nucleosome assembly protein [Staphylotrichum longicolle]